jgi:hypothetical protein
MQAPKLGHCAPRERLYLKRRQLLLQGVLPRAGENPASGSEAKLGEVP